MLSSPRGQEAGFVATRLERAAQRADDHWIPANPSFMSRIRAKLDAGEYQNDLDGLLRELKADLSLFMFCVKEALSALKEAGKAPPRHSGPFQILRAAGITRLGAIIERAEQRISTHSLALATEPQQRRLKEVMISASTAELLAQNNAVAPEEGFSAAMLRQLGLALIAWNYPTVYQRALERSDEKSSLEHAIDELLGFSPTLFGSYLLARWGLGDEVRAVVGGERARGDAATLGASAGLLQKICEVGEALARAEQPDYYPNAERDWDMARGAIRSTLGLEGFRAVQERVRAVCENYRGALPQIFADTVLLNPAQKIAEVRDKRARVRNPYLKSCQPTLRKALQELYASMDSHSASPQAVRLLARELFQRAGFTGGCVYVLDPATRQFVPRLTIGAMALRPSTAVSYTRYSAENDTVLRAFDCQAPLVNHSYTNSRNDLASISGAVGSSQKIGVLYLELPEAALASLDTPVITHFKALRRALEDALRVT